MSSQIITAATLSPESAVLNLNADVVVIGSGAGGAVAAYELAAAGQRVILLEAGPYIHSSEFREDFSHALDTLYVEHGSQANTDGDLLVLQGRCVGGSTVVNGCVAFRTPESILQDWQRQFGLTQLTVETLAPYFQRIEARLHIHSNLPHEINANSHAIIAGCEKLGVSWQPLKRNVKACALTGHCLSGCASDRKQSMLVTYVPWALEAGATLFADTTVTRILSRNGRATGVEAQVREPGTGRLLRRLSVAASRVVLAAGAVQTPVLLQQSGLANSSGQVGKNFACHPSCLVVGDYPQRIDSWSGALLGVFIDEWMAPANGGFILEAGGAGPVELSGVADPGTGRPYVQYMERVGHLAGLVTLIHDHNVGSISADAAGARIEYQISEPDFPTMLAAIRAAARVHFAGGATQVFLPTVQQHVVRSEAELEAALASLPHEAHVFRMVSYHPQGSCRMGADARSSVVSPSGECHDVRGLYITDASLFPTSIIVNPQLTVYALASYIADQIIAELTA